MIPEMQALLEEDDEDATYVPTTYHTIDMRSTELESHKHENSIHCWCRPEPHPYIFGLFVHHTVH